MEFHKPKSIHSWRELLTEIGVIVIGVAIALAAEQAVEWFHWRNEVAQARVALVEEITLNNREFFARRIASEPCLSRQVQEADAILADLEAGRGPGKFTVFRTGTGSLISDSEWQAQRASQVLTHFPHAELAQMGRYYILMQDFRLWMPQEGDAWGELAILQHPPRGITTSDLIRLRASLGAAQRIDRLIVLNAQRQMRISRQLGIADVKADAARVKAFCTGSDQDYQRYITSQELR